jgi:hypothetical protein
MELVFFRLIRGWNSYQKICFITSLQSCTALPDEVRYRFRRFISSISAFTPAKSSNYLLYSKKLKEICTKESYHRGDYEAFSCLEYNVVERLRIFHKKMLFPLSWSNNNAGKIPGEVNGYINQP